MHTEKRTITDLGGDVFVRLAPLGTRFLLDTYKGPDEDKLAILLAGAVVNAKGEPLKTREQWEAYPISAVAYELLEIATRMIAESQADAEKK